MNKEQNHITIIAFFGSSIETSVVEHAYILKSRTSCWRVSLAPTTSTSVKYTYDYVVLVFASSIHDNEYTEKSFACQDFQSYVSNRFIYFLQTTLRKCLPFELDAPPTGCTKLDFEISESMDAQRNLF